MPGREGPHHTYGGAQKNDQDYVDIVYIIGNKGRGHNQDGYPLSVFYDAAAHLPDHLGNNSPTPACIPFNIQPTY